MASFASSALLLLGIGFSYGSKPELWGSRVIGKSEGNSGLMNFQYDGDATFFIYDAEFQADTQMRVKGGVCQLSGGKVIGSPCEAKPGIANITINEVAKYSRMNIEYENQLNRYVVLFVPGCQFTASATDQIVPSVSWPLSRFQHGKPNVTVSFAVKGRSTRIKSFLYLNGDELCQWKGCALIVSNTKICTPLETDLVNNWMKFRGTFAEKSSIPKSVFLWSTNRNDFLSITVDWEQAGESPEIESCKDGSKPELWGSRVIGKIEGNSGLMNFQYDGDAKFSVYDSEFDKDKKMLVNGTSCELSGGTVIGSPCEAKPGNANITISDVVKYPRMNIESENPFIQYVVFFVPGCQFSTPKKDQIVPSVSWPLSRFQQGKPNVTVSFAVKGRSTEIQTSLYLNGDWLCHWEGTNVTANMTNICTTLEVDDANDWVEFHGTFPRNDSIPKSVFLWSVNMTDFLSITVDWEQEGESPEIESCKVETTSGGCSITAKIITLTGIFFVAYQTL